MTNNNNAKYIQYLNNLNSPFFKVQSTINKTNNIVTLKKINHSSDLSLRLKPQLNKKNLIGSYTHLKNFTETLNKSDRFIESNGIIDLKKFNTNEVISIKTIPNLSRTKRPFDLFSKEIVKRDIVRKQRDRMLKASFKAGPYLKKYRLDVSSLLKSISHFDVFLASSKNIVYNFNHSTEKLIQNLENILHDAFMSMSSLISKPVLEITANKIIIHLFFFFRNRRKNKRSFRYRNFFKKSKFNKGKFISKSKVIMNKGKVISKGKVQNKQIKLISHKIKLNNRSVFKNQNRKGIKTAFHTNRFNTYLNFKTNKGERLNKHIQFNSPFAFIKKYHHIIGYLAEILSIILNKSVQFELIKLHYPINESYILAKSIGILGNKVRRRFKYFVNASFKSAKINNPSDFRKKSTGRKGSLLHNASSSITGIQMKLGGRLLSQRIVPRFTSQTFQEGSLTRSNASLITKSRFTNKNRKGTYSITVSIGHKFF